jgi:hypothetical protein
LWTLKILFKKLTEMNTDELLSYCYKHRMIWTIEEFKYLIPLIEDGTISSMKELSEYSNGWDDDEV